MMPLRPSKIIGIGRNYVAHARELGNEVPEVPILFFKPPTALIGTGEPIVLPAVSQRVEFEAEIGVARATDMHVSIPDLVSFISGIMTLEPGDLIATGTPAGTGPLQDGDTVEVEISGVGVLSNPVRRDRA